MNCSFIAIAVFVAAVLTYIAVALSTIDRHLKEIHMTQAELIAKFDAATTAAGARIEALITELKAAGATLTPEQDAEVEAIIARLDALGANASDPVPTA